MNRPSCCTTVMALIDDASERFVPLKIDKEGAENIKRACHMIDAFIEEFSCECFDINIDEETMIIYIGVECDEVIFENGRNHAFFELIRKFDAVRFMKSSEGEFLRIEFIAKGIWRRDSGQ